jgi:hypothetical protein
LTLSEAKIGSEVFFTGIIVDQSAQEREHEKSEALFSASCSSSIKYAAERLLSKLKEEAKANLLHHLYLPPFPFLKTASDGALLTNKKVCMCVAAYCRESTALHDIR